MIGDPAQPLDRRFARGLDAEGGKLKPGTEHKRLDREGDGRVPLASAVLSGIEIRYVKAERGQMPTIPSVHQDVFRFLRGQPMQLPQGTRAVRRALNRGSGPGYGIASLASVPPWSTTVSPPMVRVNSSWIAYTYSPDSQAQAGLSMNGTMRMS